MAFLKYANAKVERKNVQPDDWNALRRGRDGRVMGGAGFTKAASGVSMDEYSPDKYLLSHCTIIASVDVDEVPNVKTGSDVVHQGRKINRPHNNYYITPETAQYINQNNDSWERNLLLACYKSFVGAENYLEHIQVPELSKGKVIDAVARDLGDSVYVDILVATDRKHTDLIASIESGEINTLSMGCSIAYSICSKCGNKAADETELCHHVKYQKGSSFIDSEGKERPIAELCGHKTDPESVTFIEASWVANPAFKGAVLRNILNESGNELTEEEAKAASQKLFEAHDIASQKQGAIDIDDFFKNANISPSDHSPTLNRHAGWGDEEEEEDTGDEEEQTPAEEISEHLIKDIKNKALQKAKEELAPVDTEFNEDADPSMNDNIIHAYQAFSSRYASKFSNKKRMGKVFNVVYTASKRGWSSLRKSSHFDNRDIIAAMYLRDEREQVVSPTPLYECLMKVGGASNYKNAKTFLRTCELALNRKATRQEKEWLIERSKFLQ